MNYYQANPEKAICLDVETTGVDPNTAEIVQLSIIDYNGKVLFNEYIKPDRAKSWPGAEAVHHISPFDVSGKPHLSYYNEKLKRIFRNAELIIAYNGDHYDIPIIARYGFPELRTKRSYDVMLKFAPIYGAWDDYHGSYTWQKLGVCADYYGYKGEDNFHDSLEDVRATLYCYKKMTEGQEDEEPLFGYEDEDEDLEGYYGSEDNTEPEDYVESAEAASYDFADLAERIYKIENDLAETYCDISASFMDRETASNAVSKPKTSVFIYGLILACDKLRDLDELDEANREAILDAFSEFPQAINLNLEKYTEPGLAEEWKYNSIIGFGNLRVFSEFFDEVETAVSQFFDDYI